MFMKNGNLVAMLKLFKHVKGLPEVLEGGYGGYKTVGFSFPTTLTPQIYLAPQPPFGAFRPLASHICYKLLKAKKAACPQSKGRLNSARPSVPRRKGARFVFGKLIGGRLSRLVLSRQKVRLATAPASITEACTATPPLKGLPKQSTLAVLNMLYGQPLLNYSLKYCRLSRRVRKILKNKYRYSKYYFVIPAFKRRLYTLHL